MHRFWLSSSRRATAKQPEQVCFQWAATATAALATLTLLTCPHSGRATTTASTLVLGRLVHSAVPSVTTTDGSTTMVQNPSALPEVTQIEETR